jgi:hypothetical protein
VYATTGYSASVINLASISLDTDNVFSDGSSLLFSDGSSLQIAAVTGTVEDGYTATLTVAIDA